MTHCVREKQLDKKAGDEMCIMVASATQRNNLPDESVNGSREEIGWGYADREGEVQGVANGIFGPHFG